MSEAGIRARMLGPSQHPVQARRDASTSSASFLSRTKRLPLLFAAGVAVAFTISACGEKEQTLPANGKRKLDEKAFVANDSPYVAPGWTPGNEASWNAQLNRRVQGQNDFSPRL